MYAHYAKIGWGIQHLEQTRKTIHPIRGGQALDAWRKSALLCNMNTTTISATLKTSFFTQILELEQMSKQGESYSNGNSRYGWRNPIRKDTGHLLTDIVSAHAPSRVLEIGTGHGLSTLYLASGLINGYAHIDTLEFDPVVARSSQNRMILCGAPVKVWIGDASSTIPKLKTPYNMVFFDAQKDQYLIQLQLLIKHKLLAENCLILADNVTDRKAECQPFLDWFLIHGVKHEILPTECGLLIANL